MIVPDELGDREASQGRHFSRTQWLEKIQWRVEKRQRNSQDTGKGEQVEGRLLRGRGCGSSQAWQSSRSFPRSKKEGPLSNLLQ